MKKSYCPNCSKYGHTPKLCPEPVISVGITCIKLDDNLSINKDVEIDNIESYNYQKLSNLSKMNIFNDKIKFLLVQRKHSLNYIEFIRGLYNEDDMTKLTEIFNYMSNNEIQSIKNNDFDYLWNSLWEKTARKKIYMKEYNCSKKKFNYIKENGNLEVLCNIVSNYDTPEWEIPKGRKNNNETNIQCAKREFYEETGINDNEYDVLNRVQNIHDDFKGTNNKLYKHIFYTGIYNNKNTINNINNNEIEKIEWFKWSDAICKIRPYYKNKINIINQLFFLIMNLCISNNYIEMM